MTICEVEGNDKVITEDTGNYTIIDKIGRNHIYLSEAMGVT